MALSPPAVAPGNNSRTLYGGSEIDTFWLWTQNTPVGGVISNGTWFINFGAYYQAFTGGSANLPGDRIAARGLPLSASARSAAAMPRSVSAVT